MHDCGCLVDEGRTRSKHHRTLDGKVYISDAHRYTNTHALQSAIIDNTCFFYHVLAHYFLETRNRLGQQPQTFLNGSPRPRIGDTRYNEINKRGARHFSARSLIRYVPGNHLT